MFNSVIYQNHSYTLFRFKSICDKIWDFYSYHKLYYITIKIVCGVNFYMSIKFVSIEGGGKLYYIYVPPSGPIITKKFVIP